MLGRTISNTSKSMYTFSKLKYMLQMYEGFIHNSYVHSTTRFYMFNQNNYDTYRTLEDDKSDGNFTKEYVTYKKEKQNILNKPEIGISSKNQILETDNLLNYEGLEKRFPFPITSLYNVYCIISNQLNIKDPVTTKVDTILSEGKVKFMYIFTVIWPERLEFEGTGTSKKLAAKQAALKCLHWLEMNGKIKDNKPILYDAKKVIHLLHAPVSVNIGPNISNEMKTLIELYEKDIKDIITRHTIDKDNVNNENYIPNELLLQSDMLSSLMPLTQITEISQTNKVRQNTTLKCNSSWKSELNKHLPISNFKEEILHALEESQVVLIKGDTGCGKSTQVPQFIFDKFASEGNATNCNMLICQPRRISAISLATRLAEERREEVGDVVGYHVRFQKDIPKMPGKMVFCTTGILLRILQSEPNLLRYSHVIIDEVHERSLDIDFLLLLLKRVIEYNNSLKVVIISATVNHDLFLKYFNCRVIAVPGLMHPVEMHFLEDLQNLGVISNESEKTNTNSPEVNLKDVVKIIKWISENKEDGAILCFLPGWHEIKRTQTLLSEELDAEKHVILPAHSKLSVADQQKIFTPTMPGVRKIILATDIAETGITVNDVTYVVDSSVRKYLSWCKVDDNLFSISPMWVSQANIIQRKGRAGRVRPGCSYHLITKKMYDMMDKFPKPEIYNVNLEKAILNSKIFTTEKAEDFFNDLIEPPTKGSVRIAVQNLMKLGVLDNEENLTILGRRIILFTFNPVIGKAMVFSAIFQCVNSILNIATIHYGTTEMFHNKLNDKSVVREKKLQYHPTSDHIALSSIYKKWKEYWDNLMDTESFCQQLNLNSSSMIMIENQRKVAHTELTNCLMLQEDDTTANTYGNDVGIIGAVLFSATDQLLRRLDYDGRDGVYIKKPYYRDENNVRVNLSSESVNYKSVSSNSYATYISRLYSPKRESILIYETTMISPLTVILFTQNDILSKPYNMVEFRNNITKVKQKYLVLSVRDKLNAKFVCDQKTADLLLKFRDIMWSIVEYYIQNKGINNEAIEEIDDYKNRLLEVLSKMLNEQSQLVDSQGHDKKI